VIDPEHRDERGPLAIAFEDPGKPYAGQSFFVASEARPSDALNALAGFSRAKKLCGVHGRAVTPEEMYANGYRVAAIRGELILTAIEKTQGRPNPLAIIPVSGEDYAANGHIDLQNARHYGASLAKAALILSEDETLRR
jgi:hypothetical protein